MEKLKGLKIRIKGWNKDIQTKAVNKKKEIMSQIDHIDRLEE